MKAWYGWLACLALVAAWWITSRPDPEAERRANVWQAHAESLAARVARDGVTTRDTLRIYVTRRDASRGVTDSLLAVPESSTIAPALGTCDSAVHAFAMTLQPAINRERAVADSALNFAVGRIQLAERRLSEYARLTDSLQYDLRKALGRRGGRVGFFVGPMIATDGRVGLGIGLGLRL